MLFLPQDHKVTVTCERRIGKAKIFYSFIDETFYWRVISVITVNPATQPSLAA